MRYVPGAELRRRAREALKGHFGMALLVVLIESLPMLIFELLLTMNMDQLTRFLQYYASIELTQQNVQVLLEQFVQLPFTQIAFFGLIAVAILTPVLQLGVYTHVLHLLRTEPAEVKDIFSRMKCFLKALWMNALRILMLYGIAFVGTLLLSLLISVLGSMISILVYILLFFVISVCMLYVLALPIMADHPEKGPIECLRESRQMMRNRRFHLIGTLLPFMIFIMAGEMVSMLIAEASYLLGNAVQMLITIAINTYLLTCIASFYEEYRKPGYDQVAEEVKDGIAEVTSSQDEIDGVIE